jgi:hypothetical protein
LEQTNLLLLPGSGADGPYLGSLNYRSIKNRHDGDRKEPIMSGETAKIFNFPVYEKTLDVLREAIWRLDPGELLTATGVGAQIGRLGGVS